MARFTPDHRGIGQLMRSPEMRFTMNAIAHREALPLAKALSPDATPYGSGYIDSWRVELKDVRIGRNVRVSARLINDAPYAAAVEWGWDKSHGQPVNKAGYHVLQSVIDVIGS
jgi:hypothetical protein